MLGEAGLLTAAQESQRGLLRPSKGWSAAHESSLVADGKGVERQLAVLAEVDHVVRRAVLRHTHCAKVIEDVLTLVQVDAGNEPKLPARRVPRICDVLDAHRRAARWAGKLTPCRLTGIL